MFNDLSQAWTEGRINRNTRITAQMTAVIAERTAVIAERATWTEEMKAEYHAEQAAARARRAAAHEGFKISEAVRVDKNRKVLGIVGGAAGLLIAAQLIHSCMIIGF
jgi:hypothetical protein